MMKNEIYWPHQKQYKHKSKQCQQSTFLSSAEQDYLQKKNWPEEKRKWGGGGNVSL